MSCNIVTERRRNGFILRIAPSRNDRVPEALKSNHLIIGWANAKDLLDPNLDWFHFRQIIHDEYHTGAETFRDSGRDSGNMWRFVREMTIQDLVVVPYGPKFYVAEVSGPACYDKSKVGDDAAYRRPVKWLNNKESIPRAAARSALRACMMARQTCVRAEDLVDEIEECLDAASRGESPSFKRDLQRCLVRATLEELRTGVLAPRGFERLIEDILRRLGAVDTKVIPTQQDKGIDVVATFRVAGTFQVIVGVQVKHYYNPDPPVGASVVQQLIRGIEEGGEDVTHGMVITSGTISPEAIAEAEKYTEGTGVPINLVDGEQLATLIVELGLRLTHDNRPDGSE